MSIFGPILLESPLTITRGKQQGLSEKAISWDITKALAEEYSLNYGFGYKADTVKLFLESQNELYHKFSELIEKQTIQAKFFNSFNTPYKKLQDITHLKELIAWEQQIALNTWFGKKLKDFCRSVRGLFSYRTSSLYLRNKLENFWKSGDYLNDFEFKRIVTGYKYSKTEYLGLQDKFRLSVTTRDLEHVNFISWGDSVSSIQGKGLLPDSYNKFKTSNVNNFVELSTNIIKRFGKDGKVLIQPATSTNDPRLGYQHLLSKTKLKDKPYLPYEKTVFEVDLGNPQESRYTLKHIAHLMGTYDTVFIFKEWVDINKEYSSIEDSKQKMKAYFEDHKEIITAVDFDGFLKIEEIFSGYSMSEQIIMNGYITDSEGNTFFDLNLREICSGFNEWGDVWTTIMSLNNPGSFLNYYFNEIRAGITPRAQFLSFILKR